jgi:hypothetical protein
MPKLWMLKTGVSLLYVGLTALLVLTFLGVVDLFGQTVASSRSGWTMTSGSCEGKTALDCAKGLVDLSMAAAIALPTAAVVAIPAILFMKERTELVCALVSTVASFAGLWATLVTEDKIQQLWWILGTLAVTLLVNLVGPYIDYLRRRAIVKAEKDAIVSLREEYVRVDKRREDAWKTQRLRDSVPIIYPVIGPFILLAVGGVIWLIIELV